MCNAILRATTPDRLKRLPRSWVPRQGLIYLGPARWTSCAADLLARATPA